jgi:hypothetical protein
MQSNRNKELLFFTLAMLILPTLYQPRVQSTPVRPCCLKLTVVYQAQNLKVNLSYLRGIMGFHWKILETQVI